jgi:HK97 family phage major capsid protein
MPHTTAARGRKFRDLFPSAKLSDNGGFKSLDEIAGILRSGMYDPRLASLSQNEGTPSAGGFSVPTQFIAEILDTSLENEIVRPRVTSQ